jgi:hypothetical protein
MFFNNLTFIGKNLLFFLEKPNLQSKNIPIIFFLMIYRLTVLLEEKVDLEAIHDINEEMQENARQVDLLHLSSFPWP